MIIVVYDVEEKLATFTTAARKGWAGRVTRSRDCHSYVHAHPAESYAQGFLVRSRQDPELIDVITKFGVLKIRSDGSFEQTGVCDF
jgi:hypothetical protein